MNQELAIRLTFIEELQQDEKLANLIRFIKKQPATKRMSVLKSREQK